MKPLSAVLLVCTAWLFASNAAGQPIQLYGKIGKTPVFFDLSRDGDTVSGWYFTLKAAEQIRLAGKLDHKGFFQIEEYTANTNSLLGTFTGRRTDGGHWRGSWRNSAHGKPLPIAFDELRSRLTDISGRYRCVGVRHDPTYAITVSEAIDLKIARGRVKSLTLSRSQRTDGDEQTCRLGPGSMRQLNAPVGILLQAKADRAESGQHCTIRLYRAGDYLVVKPGNSSRAGDDCRGAGSLRFCSSEGFWSDLVLARKTQSCRPVK